jgi:hypothetical protein
VRFRLLEHFTGFKNEKASQYTAAFTFETVQKNPTSAQCLKAFEKENQKKVRQFKVKHTPFVTLKKEWKGQPLSIGKADGFVRVFFSKYRFSAAWAAYPAYENGGLVYAFIARWKKEGSLAQAARQSWIEQSTRVKSRGKRVPYASRKR